MKNSQIAALCVAAFLVGDYTAIMRARKKMKIYMVENNREKDVLNLRVIALVELINEGSKNPEEAWRHFEEKKKFINLIDRSF